MTVSSSTNRVTYAGNGSTTVFPYTYKIFDQDDLTVILRAANGPETVQTITSDYTVSGVGNAGGGNVTMLTAPASGTTLVILRVQDLVQELDIVPNDPFSSESLEGALDRLTFMVQQHEETLGRTIKASRTNTIAGSEFTISAADRANKVFAFDSSGNVNITQELGIYRGDWAAAVSYNERDLVKDTTTDNIFIAKTAHVSSGALPITTNADAAKWDLILDVDAFTTLYDQFDDRYLGAKSSDPATDNDGNTLIDGALYWNTTDNRLKVYDLGNTVWKFTAPSPAEQGNIDALGPIAADVSAVAAIDSDVTTVAGIDANVTTVAGISANVTTVAGISADVTAVVADEVDIGVVAADLAGANTIGTVAGIAANVTTVAGISADVTTVAADGTDIGTVATNIADVNTVAGISGNVTTVAGISADVTTVAADGTDIGTVATNIANVNTVAGISGNVTTVAGISADVTAVAGDATDIGTVSANIANVNTVAGISANVTTVAGISADVTTVAGISADVVAAPIYASDAESARDQSQAARDTAEDHKLAAEAAATSATNTAAALTGFDLDAIAESKAVTAVDVFVYDTSRDSDGGAWRKRTQHTSWYNETLNTATRGARREFPAVAVIVATTTSVTIYDGDDPALPMWMVFNASALNMLFTNTIGSIVMLNGVLCAGDKSASGGLSVISFLKDDRILYIASFSLQYNSNIVERNSSASHFIISGGVGVVNRVVNDVAMTVLPDAPIDPATGLQRVTIAVATDGGVSVITDSGAVYDSAKTTAATDATIDGERLRIAFTDSDVLAYDLAPIAADGFTGDIYDPATTPALLGTTTTLAKAASGSSVGMTLLAEDEATPANSMIARVTSSYNSGYQNGDIKGAFLSDTDDTDLVGGVELVTNGTFDTDVSGWTGGSEATLSQIDGRLRISEPTSAGTAYQSFSTEVGKVYTVTAEASNPVGILAAPSVWIGSSANANNVASFNTSANYVGEISGVFVATGTTTFITVIHIPGEGYDFDNISVKLADADRSVNNNALTINGTVTRTPVATGADLVAYSGFSASNYLEQPYNSDLDFGTGDFSIIGWIKQAANTAVETIIERDSATTAQRFTLAVNASGFLTFTCDDDTTARTATSNRVVDNDVWTHFVVLYDGAGDVKIYLNGVLDDTETGSALLTLNNASAVLRVGLAVDDAEPLANADLALLRISATVPSDSQIEKIYNDEKSLFQDNAQATLYGASDAVTALAHDPVTDLLHVGTSAGRSVFSGLRRVSNTTTAVGTAISASNGLVAEE